MQITPISMNTALNSGTATGGLNASAASAASQAQAASFESMLKDVQRRETAALDSRHVVNEAGKTKRDAELKKACKGFEAMFLSLMYKQMRATVPENTLFGESNADKIWQDMRDTELMKNVADGGGRGLADMLYRQLSPQVLAQEKAEQEGAAKAAAAAASVQQKATGK